MNILLVGNGAREHAIAKALKRSKRDIDLYVFANAKNPGIYELAEQYYIGDINDGESVTEFAKTYDMDFAVIGPENPLAAGVSDWLKKEGIPSFGPSKQLAQLEASKGFTRDILKKYKIPGNPEFQAFEGTGAENKEHIEAFLEQLGGNFVVKYDALLGGKGVKVSGEHLHSNEEGRDYAMECLDECGRVVIEEKFVGEEFSLISIVDGNTAMSFPIIQDHKRAYDGDTGPNTGGMGTYSDANHLLPFITQEEVDQAQAITESTMKALEQECGEKYKGVMYGGFIATKNGVKLIEYNARFGDPEAMNVFNLLETDFVDICLATINETLGDIDLQCKQKATVCKYVVPEGYPENSVKGEEIILGDIPENCDICFAAIDEQDGRLIMTGSRAIAFTGIGNTLEEAAAIAQQAVEGVQGKVFYRKDIGTKELIQKRIDHMKKIRS